MVGARLAESVSPKVSKRLKSCGFANRSIPWRDTCTYMFELRAKSGDTPDLLWVMGYRIADELILTVVYVPAKGLRKKRLMREIGDVIASIRYAI